MTARFAKKLSGGGFAGELFYLNSIINAAGSKL